MKNRLICLKKGKLNVCAYVFLGFAMVGLFLQTPVALGEGEGEGEGEGNPYPSVCPVEYKNSAGQYITYTLHDSGQSFENSWYWVYSTGWCALNHRTLNEARKYDHGHWSYGLPYMDTVNGRNEEVTDAKIHAYDQEVSYKISDGWTKIANATCQYHCHGYSFGTYRPMQSNSATGAIRYLTDGYVSTTDMEYVKIKAYILLGKLMHSAKVTPGCPNGQWGIVKWSEKSNASGTYEKTYSTPLITSSVFKLK